MRLRIFQAMKQIEYIRKHILKVTQAEMAGIAEVTQATVSRWESGEFEPSLGELGRIRAAAIQRGLLWNDSAFFEQVPAAILEGSPS
jgi:predicted transcriptional regulator